ncbi:hypothetical protein ALC152_02300 [Arcobacter sp. 15-2]|uniref:addiction module protein n=1 Tax=Arcobacter sp. 15-2 TaxID=3374109 RepID=UPI00399CDE9B
MQLSEDIKHMNMTDKFIIMEQLWEEMSRNVEDDRFTPHWHLAILNDIEEKEKEGKLKFSNFDDVKKRLQSITK